MIENYLEMMNLTLDDLKDYLFTVTNNEEADHCFLVRQLKSYVSAHKDYYLAAILEALMKAKGADELEQHLIMLNYFFPDEDVVKLMKSALKKVILATQKPFTIYRLLRHVMDLDCMSLIRELYDASYLNEQQAAYLCLVEKNSDQAYTYLMACDSLPKQALLDYFYSYSSCGYYSLLKRFKKETPLALSFNQA